MAFPASVEKIPPGVGTGKNEFLKKRAQKKCCTPWTEGSLVLFLIEGSRRLSAHTAWRHRCRRTAGAVLQCLGGLCVRVLLHRWGTMLKEPRHSKYPGVLTSPPPLFPTMSPCGCDWLGAADGEWECRAHWWQQQSSPCLWFGRKVKPVSEVFQRARTD